MFKIKPDVYKAISELVGGGIAGHGDGTHMSYFGKTPPSKTEIDAKLVELISEWDAEEYARNRALEYPSITDVTIALAEKMEGQPHFWNKITAERLAVKAKFPKP